MEEGVGGDEVALIEQVFTTPRQGRLEIVKLAEAAIDEWLIGQVELPHFDGQVGA